MKKTWFITGASRGIGAEIVKKSLEAGDNVVATAREASKLISQFGNLPNLLSLTLDVTIAAQIDVAVDAAIKKFGHIDVLVNNAGYGHLGVFEESTPEEVRAEFNTNVFGLMDVTRSIIPLMREQRRGHILNISSIAGLRGNFGGALYNSSKFAVEGFSQSIAEELAPFGIYVTAVSPGFFRTDFLDQRSVKHLNRSINDYDQVMNDYQAFINNRSHQQLGDPKKLADVIRKLVDVKNPPVSFVAGSDAVEWLENTVAQKEAELKDWKTLSLTTDGDW
ncbi:short-chain dehydrogenase/reductase [Legionella micdadei]|nr:short-chain dehydrogenase/reductase [Legionella micdadei]NSL18393.1 SDR family NAD(P)-dependent oxidoreductase [Legionella micdadei]